MTSIPLKQVPTSMFWRDAALPFIEARRVQDGRDICYATHSHETFSIGAITGGSGIYLNRTAKEIVGAGTVVVMNPDDAHACNPIGDEPWSYRMLYVDAGWLTGLQHELGFSVNASFRAYSTTSTRSLSTSLICLHDELSDVHASHLQKQGAVIEFFSEMQQVLDPAPARLEEGGVKLVRAAQFISDNVARTLTLDDICAAANLSPAHLIRAFKRQFGMTPHAYLINRRIQLGRAQLRQGKAIAEVAVDIGFADQAHFQRAFKQYVAATPGQYRGRAPLAT